GTVVRARISGEQPSRATSPAVFAAQPIRAGHRPEAGTRPRLSRAYTEEEIFSDEELARRFRADMLRLSAQLSLQRTKSSALPRSQPTTSAAVADRWGAYLAECERTIGLPLTSKLFGRLITGMSAPSTVLSWNVDVTTTVE